MHGKEVENEEVTDAAGIVAGAESKQLISNVDGTMILFVFHTIRNNSTGHRPRQTIVVVNTNLHLEVTSPSDSCNNGVKRYFTFHIVQVNNKNCVWEDFAGGCNSF